MYEATVATPKRVTYPRAGYYDPATAQFLSRDPLTSVSQSPYGYVAGNPLNLTDPLGLNPVGNVCDAAGDFFCQIAGRLGNLARNIEKGIDGKGPWSLLWRSCAAGMLEAGEVTTRAIGVGFIGASVAITGYEAGSDEYNRDRGYDHQLPRALIVGSTGAVGGTGGALMGGTAGAGACLPAGPLALLCSALGATGGGWAGEKAGAGAGQLGADLMWGTPHSPLEDNPNDVPTAGVAS